LALDLSHLLLRELAAIRKEGKVMKYLRPDAKSQVTIEYNDRHQPKRIDAIVISTQHDENVDQVKIAADIQRILIPRVKKLLPTRIQRLFNPDITYFINPTGKFVIGGPHGDTGLTGRKIIVDTYGGKGAHGGGAFSGKDPSKVDRSAAYATRHIAKNLVAAGLCDQALVQVAYAIGVAQPVGLFVNTYNSCKIKGLSDGELAQRLMKLFDLRPAAIVKRFGLKNPIFSETAAYGHFGRTPAMKTVLLGKNNEPHQVETFTWERLDAVEQIKKEFGI
jgi:S-adenosylmethionine synthetase